MYMNALKRLFLGATMVFLVACGSSQPTEDQVATRVAEEFAKAATATQQSDAAAARQHAARACYVWLSLRGVIVRAGQEDDFRRGRRYQLQNLKADQ